MTSFDDMQALWQTASDPAPRIHLGRQTELRREAERFDRRIRRRDQREFAGVALILGFAVWTGVGASPALRVGLVLMVLGAAVAVASLWRAQRRVPPPAPDLPAADALRQSLARVEIQIQLLRSVLWWYLAPIAVGPLVFIGVKITESVQALPPDTSLGVTLAKLGLGALALGVVGGVNYLIYRLNQQAVRQDLEPFRERLTRLLADLTAAETS